MVAMLAFGGTYAYFSAFADEAGTGSFTTGTVVLSIGDAANVTRADVMPGDTITTAGTVKSTATRGAYVGLTLTPDTTAIPADYISVKFVDGASGGKWVPMQTTDKSVTYYVWAGTGATATPAGETGEDEDSYAEVVLDFQVKVTLTWETPDAYQNKTISYIMKAYSIQAANVPDDANIADLFTATPTT